MKPLLESTNYDVTARAFSRNTHRPSAPKRTERIDLATNALFMRATSVAEIIASYEAFWNDLNPASEDIVKVLAIAPVCSKHRLQTHR